ncbi:type II toxin-antitoxin system HicB family antitoxin [Frankia sp. CiP3]|uniref:type II toxin-antitoxin system HicB family antitoxin n=1 Tax=Frankia sp. CiP3 TaxID=2880971 RepID=UPI001EF6F87E|nr:type II toxin-antitoxin system HicB family antitoxin [Frankia sp. CiP3]
MSSYLIVVEGDGSTNYSAYAPDLPGVAATGDTPEECEAEMREAIAFHIEGLRFAGEPVPPATSRGVTVEVAA